MDNSVTFQGTFKKINGDQKSIDDSDNLDIVFEKTVSNSSLVQKPAINEIECICLDDSDSENAEISVSPKITDSQANFLEIKKEASKKIDYLNLDSSDTDDEQERIQNNVNSLLCSAAILNDIECGPTKPVPELDLAKTLPFCNDDSSISKKRPTSPSALVVNSVDVIDNRITSAVDVSEVSNKKTRSDPLTANNSAVNISTVVGPDPRIRMYRKDERIVAAYKKKGISHIPSTLSHTFTAHDKAISSLSWCAIPYSHLFLSSSLDCSVKIWDIYSQNKPLQTLSVPLGARSAKWSKNGEYIVSGGFGKQLHVIDVLSGETHMIYNAYNYVSCIAIHPYIEDVILCGTQNAIFGFDLRVDSELPVRTFLSKCGEVLDITFLNKNEFACSTSVVSHDSADRTIMVWDFDSGAIMSNEVFLERYTCPSLKMHPIDSSFIAQTNGDYIASFSSQNPYKIKNKRYMGHKVSGFGIECDISPDGQYIASGDAKGDLYFYNYRDSTVVKKFTLKPDVAANRLQWHPVLSSTMIVATWDGQIQLWK